MDIEEIRDHFSALAGSDDDDFDMGQAALLVAATEYPWMDVDGELRTLDSLAAGAASRLDDEDDPLYQLNVLSEYLFDEVGFAGNRDSYYDPRNSFLNDVIARRLGIPIALSLVYMEVGKRLGVPLVGIGMPGHFLVRHRAVPDMFVDPFHRGILMSEDECPDRLREVAGIAIPWDSRFLAPIGQRAMIGRLVRNLKGTFLRAGDLERALTMIGFIVELEPESTQERLDRGIVYYRMGDYLRALDDLRGYLEAAPSITDLSGVQRLIGRIEAQLDA